MKSSRLAILTPLEEEQRRSLRKMQRVALLLLGVMAVIFAVSYALEHKYPWLTFVRAASEGGMVGGLADWFAVTALFRHPLGLKIPHTNLIAKKKDELGEGLASFIETNFLSDQVISEKLSSTNIAERTGAWITKDAKLITQHGSSLAIQAINLVDDRDIRAVFDALIRTHIVEKDWGPTLGNAGKHLIKAGQHDVVIDMLAEQAERWLIDNPRVFARIVHRKVPSWAPGFVGKLLDSMVHGEAVKFTQEIQKSPEHPFRAKLTRILEDYADRLTHDAALRAKLSDFGQSIYASERVRGVAENAWAYAKQAILHELETPDSSLRTAIAAGLQDFGKQLQNNPDLQANLNERVSTTALSLAKKYRHKLASIVAETVANWEAREAAEKIELQVGKDLQFIRINGTVIGALAGLSITGIAWIIKALAG